MECTLAELQTTWERQRLSQKLLVKFCQNLKNGFMSLSTLLFDWYFNSGTNSEWLTFQLELFLPFSGTNCKVKLSAMDIKLTVLWLLTSSNQVKKWWGFRKQECTWNVAGKPRPPIFNSEMREIVSGVRRVNISWSCDSREPVSQYQLMYRDNKVGSD